MAGGQTSVRGWGRTYLRVDRAVGSGLLRTQTGRGRHVARWGVQPAGLVLILRRPCPKRLVFFGVAPISDCPERRWRKLEFVQVAESEIEAT